uniref:Rhodanese-like domain-containing protein n=1 Tax=Desulfacinum infernum TaxID=35837 RepID=A0A831ZLM0_9BACT
MTQQGKTSPWREAMGQGVVLVAAACVLAAVSNGLRSDSIPWVGDWSAASGTTEDGLGLEISLEEAQILFFTKEAVFLDARSPDAYARGHIEGARNLPWVFFEERAPTVLADISKETPIVTYCDGEGCALSTELAVALIARGYDQVRVLANGWSVWVENGLPTASGP